MGILDSPAGSWIVEYFNTRTKNCWSDAKRFNGPDSIECAVVDLDEQSSEEVNRFKLNEQQIMKPGHVIDVA